jgi:hypothetical protein
VTDSQEAGVFRLKARAEQKTPGAGIEKTEENIPEAGGQKILVMVTSDCLGSGDDALGGKLMISYLKTVKEMGTDL